MGRSLRAVIVCGLALTGASCAHGNVAGVEPKPFPHSAAGADRAAAAASAEVRHRIVDRALEQRGAKYVAGGERPQIGFDCSGLVRFVFRGERIELPRTVAGQFTAGRGVEVRSIESGDLIFFNIASPGPSHVGIAVTPSTFVHAPGAGGAVRVERFDTQYWKSRLAGIRRVVR
jgi:cell wall-associated NlpC family hydrolase